MFMNEKSVVIRAIREEDRAFFIQMADEFYHTPAVHEAIPLEYHVQTFDQLMKGTPFAQAHIIEESGQAVGYALLAFTWSNEGGGMVVWLEEIYIRAESRGHGLGAAYIRFLHREYKGQVTRMRLEVDERNGKAGRFYERQGFKLLPYKEMIRNETESE